MRAASRGLLAGLPLLLTAAAFAQVQSGGGGSGGGGGGGAITAATGSYSAGALVDGADVTQGTKADTPCTLPATTTACSVDAVLKAIGNAVNSPTPAGTNLIGSVSGSYFNNVASSVLTRASNTTAYAANETVCLLTSTTVCAPITVSIANTNAGKGLINRVSLLKSGSSTTNATFTIWFFSAAPGTSTPSQYDATAYAGPRAADMPNYIGNASCSTATATSDTTAQVWYDCTLSNPNTGGALDFQALSGATTIDALISVTAAYTPTSAETFTAYVSGIY